MKFSSDGKSETILVWQVNWQCEQNIDRSHKNNKAGLAENWKSRLTRCKNRLFHTTNITNVPEQILLGPLTELGTVPSYFSYDYHCDEIIFHISYK